MLLQTNSYIVPRDKRVEHARLLRRFRQTLLRLGCDHFEVYEQTGANWSSGDNSGRFVQIMRFRDRKHQLSVQNAERAAPSAQALLKEVCDLINLPYQQQQGLFAVGFYTSFLRMPEFPPRAPGDAGEPKPQLPDAGDAQAEDENGAAAADALPADAGDEAADSADQETPEIDPEAGFQSQEEDFAAPGRIPAVPREQADQAENPTFPSKS